MSTAVIHSNPQCDPPLVVILSSNTLENDHGRHNFRHDGDDPETSHLDALAQYVVGLMCVATSGYSESPNQHRSEMSRCST